MKKKYAQIEERVGGYYAITLFNNVIYGGDSACEDHYSIEHIQAIFNAWDGSLFEGQISIESQKKS